MKFTPLLLALVFSTAILLTYGVTHAQFDGAPGAPQIVKTHPEYASFDVQVHQNDGSFPSMQAQHGDDCAAPPASHTIVNFDQSVFICNNHVMTAINGTGYGAVYLTKSELLDCMVACAVSFDISTERMSTRDWFDIYITPWTDNLALPLLSDVSESVDLQGPPQNVIHVSIDNAQSTPILTTTVNGAGNRTVYNSVYDTPNIQQGIAGGTNQAAVRQPFRLTITGQQIKFERLDSPTAPRGLVFFNETTNAVRTSDMVVQFGHHSYNPTKDGAGIPATWHWDEFVLSPSTHFSLIHTSPRAVVGSGGTISFDSPAPAGTCLRFSALGTVKVNGQTAAKKAVLGSHPEHASSYCHPVPQGSTSAAISLSCDSWYCNPLIAQDFALWAKESGGAATSTPSATNTPAPATPTPTPTVVAPTPTPTPQVYRCQVQRSNGSYQTLWTRAGGGACP